MSSSMMKSEEQYLISRNKFVPYADGIGQVARSKSWLGELFTSIEEKEVVLQINDSRVQYLIVAANKSPVNRPCN